MITCPHCHEPVAVYTAASAGAELGITDDAVRQRAARRGITGTRLDKRTVVYSQEDLEGMRVEQVRGRKPLILVATSMTPSGTLTSAGASDDQD